MILPGSKQVYQSYYINIFSIYIYIYILIGPIGTNINIYVVPINLMYVIINCSTIIVLITRNIDIFIVINII